jgi:hypothetical protein
MMSKLMIVALPMIPFVINEWVNWILRWWS